MPSIDILTHFITNTNWLLTITDAGRYKKNNDKEKPEDSAPKEPEKPNYKKDKAGIRIKGTLEMHM